MHAPVAERTYRFRILENGTVIALDENGEDSPEGGADLIANAVQLELFPERTEERTYRDEDDEIVAPAMLPNPARSSRADPVTDRSPAKKDSGTYIPWDPWTS